jgi:hypothetical protein
VGLGGLRLDAVPDPRAKRSRRWKLPYLLTVVVSGLAAGCKSLKEVERLTAQLSPAVRRRLQVFRRVPDTTLRDLLMQLPLDGLRVLIRRQVRGAHRRRQLAPVGLPFGVLAIDGKYTATRLPDPRYAQRQGDSSVVRTLTASLVSARAAVCVDAKPLLAEQNEGSAFSEFVDELLAEYGSLDLFRLVSCDAGFTSAANARYVVERGLHYLFALKENQPTLSDLARRYLERLPADKAEATTEDRTDNRTVEIRRVWRTEEMAGENEWGHLRQVMRVQREVRRDGAVVLCEDRFFATSLTANRLTGADWLGVVRAHWRVENECHGTWDREFAEDDHPWLYAGRGMLAVILLRRVVGNLLALFRAVTLRGERKGQVPWAELMSWLQVVLVAATDEHLHKLRWALGMRAGPAPPATGC